MDQQAQLKPLQNLQQKLATDCSTPKTEYDVLSTRAINCFLGSAVYVWRRVRSFTPFFAAVV
jgi:hypothetical protein